MRILDKIIGGKEEEVFTSLFQSLSSLLHEIGHELAEVLRLSVKGKDVEKVAKRIIEIERRVDEVRERAESEVYKSSFLPFTRADRLLILEDIDSVADIAEEIATVLSTKNLPKRIVEDMVKVSEDLEKTIEALASLLSTSLQDIGKVLDCYTVVRINRRNMKEKIFNVYEKIFADNRIKGIELSITLEVLRRIMVMHRKIGDVADRARAMVIKYL